jgi:uncharacterized alkaline shock family protein YloU
VEKGQHVVATSDVGTVTITSDAIRQIVGHVLAESYGVVGRTRRGAARLLPTRLTDGVSVRREDDGLVIEVGVVVEYGLKLAEVASAVRQRVAYEVPRVTGLAVSSVTVNIDRARKST